MSYRWFPNVSKLSILWHSDAWLLSIEYIMTDRRRVNGPPGGTAPPAFASSPTVAKVALAERKGRTRAPSELRKICRYCTAFSIRVGLFDFPKTPLINWNRCSPQNWPYTVGVGLCILWAWTFYPAYFGSQIPQDQLIRAEADVYCTWPTASSQICNLLLSPPSLNPCQFCTFRSTREKGLYPWLQRTRS